MRQAPGWFGCWPFSAGNTLGRQADVNERDTIQPNDSNGSFRIVDCNTIYNPATGSLSGVGKYEVKVVINDTALSPGATLDLR